MKKFLAAAILLTLVPTAVGAAVNLKWGQKANISNATIVAAGGNKITGDNDNITTGWGSSISVTNSVVHSNGGSYVNGNGSSYCYSSKPNSDKLVNCL